MPPCWICTWKSTRPHGYYVVPTFEFFGQWTLNCLPDLFKRPREKNANDRGKQNKAPWRTYRYVLGIWAEFFFFLRKFKGADPNSRQIKFNTIIHVELSRLFYFICPYIVTFEIFILWHLNALKGKKHCSKSCYRTSDSNHCKQLCVGRPSCTLSSTRCGDFGGSLNYRAMYLDCIASVQTGYERKSQYCPECSDWLWKGRRYKW